VADHFGRFCNLVAAIFAVLTHNTPASHEHHQVANIGYVRYRPQGVIHHYLLGRNSNKDNLLKLIQYLYLYINVFIGFKSQWNINLQTDFEFGIENHNLLGGDEKIHLGCRLCLSFGRLTPKQRNKKRKTSMKNIPLAAAAYLLHPLILFWLVGCWV
jgi:hypothetical protein